MTWHPMILARLWYHQPRLPWNKGSHEKTTMWGKKNSCEVASWFDQMILFKEKNSQPNLRGCSGERASLLRQGRGFALKRDHLGGQCAGLTHRIHEWCSIFTYIYIIHPLSNPWQAPPKKKSNGKTGKICNPKNHWTPQQRGFDSFFGRVRNFISKAPMTWDPMIQIMISPT